MAKPCDHLQLFMDGELPSSDAEAFREHLPDCAQCQAGMTEIMQFKAQLLLHSERAPRQERLRGPARRLPRWGWAAAAVSTAAVAVLLVVLTRGGGTGEDVWLGGEPERRLEARVMYPSADRHRPLAARQMGGPGSKSQPLPLEALDRLQRQGEAQGLAAAYLVRGEAGLVDPALTALEPLPATPQVESDRAAAQLGKGAPEEALRHLDRALAEAPALPQALWNRGLALRELGLKRVAARSFEEVAARGEPGWAEEATRNASLLRESETRRRGRWQEATKAGKALASGGAGPSPELLADLPPVLRLHFYDAVRTRESKEQVLALLPLARELDAQQGGEVLARHISRIAEHDFTRRAPLARAYGQLLRGELPKPQIEALIADLLRSSEDDLLMGALIMANATGAHLDAFQARAEASGDPWFLLLAAQERAKAELAQGEPRAAKRTLEEALGSCASTPLVYRCMGLELDLAYVDTVLVRLDEAREHALRAWRLARSANDWNKENQALSHLAQVARVRNDRPLARAFLEEVLERNPGEARQELLVHQSLAMLELDSFRFGRARSEIDRALATGLPLTLVGVLALSDIARQQPSPADEAAMTRAVSALRESGRPGERAVAEQALGRFLIEKDRAQGRARLREVIREVGTGGLLERDENARRARAYSFTALILDAGKAGEHEAALELFAEELGAPVPRQCAVAAAEDSERALLVVRGPQGQTRGFFRGDLQQSLPEDLRGFVSPEALGVLQGCERVEALARPPLYGRAGLLPPEWAWSYRTRAGEAPRLPSGKARHLVVKDVELSPERSRELPRLGPWSPGIGEGEEARLLEGAEATPSRVLGAMRDATEIDLVTHGIIDETSDASYLVLAEEGGRDELTATRIREQKLEGAPLVVLAACHAARPAPVLHELASLPAAFIQAGARGVLAATVPIPDREAGEFFNAVRARIRQGTPAALALRDERMKWLGEQKGRTWLDAVLFFE